MLIYAEDDQRGFPYLTAVIDWFSRCIAGWKVDDTFAARMVINALKQASKAAKLRVPDSDHAIESFHFQFLNHETIWMWQFYIRTSLDSKFVYSIRLTLSRHLYISFAYRAAFSDFQPFQI